MASSPLSVFRKYQYWLLVVLGVILMVTFVVAEPLNDFLQRRADGGGSRAHEVVLEWNGGNSVREGDLQAMYANHVLTMNFLTAVFEETLDRKGSPKVQLPNRETREEGIVLTMLLAEKARQLGMVLSDQALRDYLDQLADQTLSPQELDQLLDRSTNSQLSVAAFYQRLREELLALTMQQLALEGALSTTPANNWQLFQQLHKRVMLEMAPLPASEFVAQVPDPTADDIQQLYDKYKEQFRDPNRPEPGFRRLPKTDFAYLVFDFDKLLDEEMKKLTEEEIQAEYDAGLKRGDFRRLQLPPTSPITPPGENQTPGDAAAAPENGAPSEGEKKDDSEAKKDDPPSDAAPKDDAAKESDASKDADKDQGACQEPAPQPADTATESTKDADPPQPAAAADKPAEAQPEGDKKEPPAPPAPPAANETQAAPGAEQPETTTSDGSTPPVTEPPSEHKPLSEVREELMKKLARPRAQERLTTMRNEAQTVLSSHFQKYIAWKQLSSDQPQPPPPDVNELAARLDVQGGRTGLVDYYEAEASALGDASRFDMMTGSIRAFRDIAYNPRLQLFQPTEVVASDITKDVRYLFWKVEEKSEFIPELQDIRQEVADTWKLMEARKLAAEKAELLRREAAAASGTLAERLPEMSEKVFTTNEFSWRSSFMPGSGVPQLSSVEGVDAVSQSFMETVFATGPNQIGVTSNAGESVTYVFRVARISPSEDQLRHDFLRDLHAGSREVQMMRQVQFQQHYANWLSDLEKEFSVQWQRAPEPFVRE